MPNVFGVPGESARQQAERRRQRQRELERLQQREANWDGGARGEESTAETIAERCPEAVVLHDRRMPDSRANVDHIVLVPSGVWVVDSKRMKGKIKVENGESGTQRLLINGNDQTELVHKLNWQVGAVRAAMAELDPQVSVNGAFCFWLPIDNKRDLLNPRIEDNGLPLLRTWTINGYPLFYGRQLARRLNSAGTLTREHAAELAGALAERFPAAAGPASPRLARPVSAAEQRQFQETEVVAPLATPTTPAAPTLPAPEAVPTRLSKDAFKAAKAAEQQRVWEEQRLLIEAALGGAAPSLLTERLPRDGAVWCHSALWHSRVYLACVHGKVGQTVPYTKAASVVAAHHGGRPGPNQWRALTAFLEHLRAHGYLSFAADADGRVHEMMVTAELAGVPRG